MPLCTVECESQVLRNLGIRAPCSHELKDRLLARREAVLVPGLIVRRAVGHGITVPEPGDEKPTL